MRLPVENHDVVIIGGGPSGLATALALREQGINDVVVLERESEAGGIPRHCGHRGFGYFKRWGFLTGPQLAAKLRAETRSIDVRSATTVLEFSLRGSLRVHGPDGISELGAKKIVLATGTRESSRAALLIGGKRLPGVINTGTLQQQVYLHHAKPFSKPVIIGSEWVSFSALMTCRHAAIKPVAMISEGQTIDAPFYFSAGARFAFGVPVINQAQVIAFHGSAKVEAVEIAVKGKARMVACDGVIVTGKFRSEHALYSNGFLEREGHAPKVTEGFKTSKPDIYAVGNVLGRLETAGTCMIEARALATMLAGELK
jgi:thioredoxin reductase